MTDPTPYLHALLGALCMLTLVQTTIIAFAWHKIGRDVIDDVCAAGRRVVKNRMRGKR